MSCTFGLAIVFDVVLLGSVSGIMGGGILSTRCITSIHVGVVSCNGLIGLRTSASERSVCIGLLFA